MGLSKRATSQTYVLSQCTVYIGDLRDSLWSLSRRSFSIHRRCQHWDNRFQMFLDLPNFNKLKLFPLTERKFYLRDLAFLRGWFTGLQAGKFSTIIHLVLDWGPDFILMSACQGQVWILRSA